MIFKKNSIFKIYLKLLNLVCRQSRPIFFVQYVQIFRYRPQPIDRPKKMYNKTINKKNN